MVGQFPELRFATSGIAHARQYKARVFEFEGLSRCLCTAPLAAKLRFKPRARPGEALGKEKIAA
jgi:hypothetical protein